MNYGKAEVKGCARENRRGIWAAALTPFNEAFAFDEVGFRGNIRHLIDGLFIAGTQGEFFSMSLAVRKRTFDIAVVRGHCLGQRRGDPVALERQQKGRDTSGVRELRSAPWR